MSATWRKVIDGAALLVMFIAFFTYFIQTRSNEPWPPFSWRPYAIGAAAVMILAVEISRLRTAGRLNNQGTRLLASGKPGAALRLFERASELAPRAVATVISNNIGVAQLLLWRIAEARKTLRSVSAEPKTLRQETLGSESTHALVCALNNELSVAKQWLAVPSTTPVEGHVALAKAVIACREAAFDVALRELDEPATKHLGGQMSAWAQALRAWAAEQSSGTSLPIDRAMVFGEAEPASVRAVWPELADAIDRAATK